MQDGSRRAFAFGAGDTEDWGGAKLEEEAGLTGYFDAGLARCLEARVQAGKTGCTEEQVEIGQTVEVIRADTPFAHIG